MATRPFTLDDAKNIAALAYRTKAPGPWVGREDELFDVLYSAQLYHDVVLEMSAEDNKSRPTTREARKAREKIKQFTQALLETAKKWQSLQPEAKQWLAEALRDRSAEYDRIGLVISNLFSDAHDPSRRIEQAVNLPTVFSREAVDAADRHFENLRKISEHLQSKPANKRGERGYLQALAAFIQSLEENWDAKKLGAEFSGEFDKETGEPISAAARLVVHAAQYLDKTYTATNCQSAWRPRRAKSPRKKGAQLKRKWPSQSRGL